MQGTGEAIEKAPFSPCSNRRIPLPTALRDRKMEVLPYLKLMVQKNASDLFFTTGARVQVKIEGRLIPVGDAPLNPEQVKELIYSLLDDEQIAELERELELNLGYSVPKLGRFRVNVFWQRGELAMVIRYVKLGVPTIEELNLPLILKGDGLE